MLLRSKRIELPESSRREIAASQQWRCFVCGRLLSAYYEIDHRRPLHLGGDNCRDNLNALCSNCHAEKSGRESRERSLFEIQRHEMPATAFCLRCQTYFSPFFKHTCSQMTGDEIRQLNARKFNLGFVLHQRHLAKQERYLSGT